MKASLVLTKNECPLLFHDPLMYYLIVQIPRQMLSATCALLLWEVFVKHCYALTSTNSYSSIFPAYLSVMFNLSVFLV